MAPSIKACPDCGSPVMQVPSTGLISCLAQLEFRPCRWHVRVKPWSEHAKRKTVMTDKEKKLAAQQREIDRRIAEYEAD